MFTLYSLISSLYLTIFTGLLLVSTLPVKNTWHSIECRIEKLKELERVYGVRGKAIKAGGYLSVFLTVSNGLLWLYIEDYGTLAPLFRMLP
jgi:hypothetical protein